MNTIKLNTIGTPFPKAEGGGGDTPSGGGNIEYLDVSGVDYMVAGQIPLKPLIASLGYSIKFVNPINDALTVSCCAVLYTSFSATEIQSLDYIAVEININGIYSGNQSGGIMTFKDALLEMGVPQAELDAIPRITEEEFYNLETA